jgi:raffinose/stachyose/melibiose transport system substrate-binding protein
MDMRSIRKRGVVAAASIAVVALAAACSSSGGSGSGGSAPGTSPGGGATSAATSGSSAASASEPKAKLTWWHNANADPGKSAFQHVADAFHAAHPTVSFQVVPMQNEQFKTKIPVALQSNDPPSLFQQWGGGNQATQVQSGKLMDVSSQVSSWISELGPGAKGWQTNGKWYGVPYDYHIVGFWYRTDLFHRAGISSPPTTLDQLNADVAKLKAAGITPIAIGSKDQWPDAFWWEYFVLRDCPQSTITSSIANVKFSDQCFVKAGDDLKAFLATKPFQPGFLGTAAQQGAGSSAGMVANGKAAMELQGDWEAAVMPSLATDKNFASKLGWFPFPSVSGGGGDQAAGLGGGDGFSCTTKATTACPDFLKYLSSGPVQRKLVKAGAITLPSNADAQDAISSPTLKTVLAYLQKTQYNQLYFDQALPTNPGLALDAAVANFFAGKGSPQDVAKSVANANQ